MEICFVASECSPFIKVGGLADVVGSLPQALTRNGAHCCVVVPLYKKINDHKWQELKQTPHNGYLVINMRDINNRRHQILMPSLISHFRTQPAQQPAEQDDE